jgi:hypothetical protein
MLGAFRNSLKFHVRIQECNTDYIHSIGTPSFRLHEFLGRQKATLQPGGLQSGYLRLSFPALCVIHLRGPKCLKICQSIRTIIPGREAKYNMLEATSQNRWNMINDGTTLSNSTVKTCQNNSLHDRVYSSRVGILRSSQVRFV